MFFLHRVASCEARKIHGKQSPFIISKQESYGFPKFFFCMFTEFAVYWIISIHFPLFHWKKMILLGGSTSKSFVCQAPSKNCPINRKAKKPGEFGTRAATDLFFWWGVSWDLDDFHWISWWFHGGFMWSYVGFHRVIISIVIQPNHGDSNVIKHIWLISQIFMEVHS